jgi:hypothetical protein
MVTVNPRDFEDVRSRWLAGLCPCCGSEICGWDHTYRDESYEPEPIAEGVMICGRCVGNEHVVDPEFRDAMLAALLPGKAVSA